MGKVAKMKTKPKMVSPKKPSSDKNEKCARVWEKNRRDKLRALFEELSKLIPKFDPANPPSRPELIQKVIEYIRELQAQNEDLLNGGFDEIYKNKLEALKRRVKELLSRVDQLSSILRTANIQLPPLVIDGATPPAWTVSRPKHWTDKIKLPENKVQEVVKQLEIRKKSITRKVPKRKKKPLDSSIKENKPVSQPITPKIDPKHPASASNVGTTQITQLPTVIQAQTVGQPSTYILTTQGNLVPVITPAAGVLTPVFINKPPVIVLQPPQPPPVPQPVVIVPSNKKRISRESTVTTFSNKRPISALSKQSHSKRDGKCVAHKNSGSLQPKQVINAPAVSPTTAFLNAFPVVATSAISETEKVVSDSEKRLDATEKSIKIPDNSAKNELANDKNKSDVNQENPIVVATLNASSSKDETPQKQTPTKTSSVNNKLPVIVKNKEETKNSDIVAAEIKNDDIVIAETKKNSPIVSEENSQPCRLVSDSVNGKNISENIIEKITCTVAAITNNAEKSTTTASSTSCTETKKVDSFHTATQKCTNVPIRRSVLPTWAEDCPPINQSYSIASQSGLVETQSKPIISNSLPIKCYDKIPVLNISTANDNQPPPVVSNAKMFIAESTNMSSLSGQPVPTSHTTKSTENLPSVNSSCLIVSQPLLAVSSEKISVSKSISTQVYPPSNKSVSTIIQHTSQSNRSVQNEIKTADSTFSSCLSTPSEPSVKIPNHPTNTSLLATTQPSRVFPNQNTLILPPWEHTYNSLSMDNAILNTSPVKSISDTSSTPTYTTLMPPVSNSLTTQSSWLPLPPIYSNEKYSKPSTTTWRPIPPEPVWSSTSISETWTDYNTNSGIISLASTTAVYTSAGFYYRNTASSVTLCDTTWSTGISKASVNSTNKFTYSENLDNSFTYKSSTLEQNNPWHQTILPSKNENYQFNLPKPPSSSTTASYTANFYSTPSSTCYSSPAIVQNTAKGVEGLKVCDTANNPFNHTNTIMKSDKTITGNYINSFESTFPPKAFTLDAPKTLFNDPSYSLPQAKPNFISSGAPSSSVFTPSIYSEVTSKPLSTNPYSVPFSTPNPPISKLPNTSKEPSKSTHHTTSSKPIPTSTYTRPDNPEQRAQKTPMCDNSLWNSAYIPQPSCVATDIGIPWNQTDFLGVGEPKDPKLRPPINWMTDPDHRTDSLNHSEDLFPPRYQVPPNILDYCLTSTVEEDGSKTKRKKEDPLTQDYFNWMSMKCDPMVVPSTLPTLVGDLALGDPPPTKKPKINLENQEKPESFANLSKNIFDVTQNDQKNPSETIVLKNIFELPTAPCNKQKQTQSQNSFLSVSQLVEPHLDTGQQKSDYTYYNQRNGKGKRTSGWKCGEKKCQQNVKSCATNYSTEALLRSNQVASVESEFTLGIVPPPIYPRDYQIDTTDNSTTNMTKQKTFARSKKPECWRQDCKVNTNLCAANSIVKKNQNDIVFPNPEEPVASANLPSDPAMFSYPRFPTNPPGALLSAPNFPQPIPDTPPIFPQSPARCLPTDKYTVRYPARKPQTYSRSNKSYPTFVENIRKTTPKNMHFSKASVPNQNVTTPYGQPMQQTANLSTANFLPNTNSPNSNIIHYSKPTQVQQIPHPIMSSITAQCPIKSVNKPDNVALESDLKPVIGAGLPLSVPYTSFPPLPAQTPGSSGSSLANFNLSTIFPEINKKGYNQYS